MQDTQYLVKHDGQVQGPFEMNFIEAMIMAGVYASDVLIKEAGGDVFTPMSQGKQPERRASQIAGQPPRPPPIPAQNNGLRSPPPLRQTNTPPVNSRSVSTGSNRARKAVGWETKLAWGVGIVAAIIIIAVYSDITASSSSKHKANSSNYSSPPQRRVETKAKVSNTGYTKPEVTSAYHPISVSPPPDPIAFSAPPAPKPIDDSKIYRDASGRTYRVPNSAYYRLLAMKAALDPKKVALDQEESAISALGAEIDRLRLFIDRTNQFSVDQFNQKVNRFNDANKRFQPSVDDYNRDVNAFNSELARVGTLIR